MPCDTQRERERGRALTKDVAATLTNGRFKFRGSTASETLGAPCEQSQSVSIIMGRAEKRDGRKEGGMKQREETEEETRGESLRSPVALTRLFPAETLGQCPPLGHKPQLSGKLVWSTPGTTPTH